MVLVEFRVRETIVDIKIRTDIIFWWFFQMNRTIIEIAWNINYWRGFLRLFSKYSIYVHRVILTSEMFSIFFTKHLDTLYFGTVSFNKCIVYKNSKFSGLIFGQFSSSTKTFPVRQNYLIYDMLLIVSNYLMKT